MGMQRQRSLKLNRGVKPLTARHVQPQFDEITADNYNQSLQAKLDKLRQAIELNNAVTARIYANQLFETSKRVGSWVYHGHNAHAARIWQGAEGWAARLLKLELELAKLETESANAARKELRPLVGAICEKEQITQEQ